MLTPEGVELRVELAERGERAGAFLIDALFVIGAVLVLVFGTIYLMTLLEGYALAFGLAVFFLLRTFYFSFFELIWRGRTPGKRLIGLRVIDRAGGPLRPSSVVVRNLMRRGWNGRPVVTILGLTFKEDVPDTRNTRVAELVRELRNFGIVAQIHDPRADADETRRNHGLELLPADACRPADAVVVAVAHREFVTAGWPLVRKLLKPDGGFVADVQGMLDRATIPPGVTLWRL